MKTNLLYIFLILTLWSCQECDFSIPQEQRDFFSYYSVGDTIYFESDKRDIDTITIVSIDSIEECKGILAIERKDIIVGIKHLPSNNWIGGTWVDKNGNLQIYNQSLLIVSKEFDEDNNYWINIQYRNFIGELHDSCLVQDNYLESLGVSQYWKMKNEAANWNQYKNDTSVITSLIYTKEFGVTEYTKRNGEVLRIKNP